MITFKQFLSEEVITPWTMKDLNVEKAIALLNEHYTDGITAIKNDGIIYRGLGSGHGKFDFQEVDTSNSERTSRDTNNIYQLMMDSSSSMKEVPSRSKSFICSSSMRTAGRYAKNNVGVVIPANGTILAISDEIDFILTNIKGSITKVEIEFFSAYVGHLLSEIGVRGQTKKEKFINAQQLDDELTRFSPEFLLFMWACCVNPGALNLSDGPRWLTSIGLFANFTDLTRDRITEFIKKESSRVNGSGKEFLSVLANNPTKKFTALSNEIMTPDNLSISTEKFGQSMPRNSEVWFSGKCMVISLDMFAKILIAIKDRGDKIGVNVAGDFRDRMYKIRKSMKS
jgi:hypothetical protein